MTAPRIHPPSLGELRANREAILRLAAAHQVTNVRVFGSVARGDADARDIDILVDLPPDARGFDAFGILDALRQDLERVLGCAVDVVTLRGPFSPQGVVLAQQIAREAVAL